MVELTVTPLKPADIPPEDEILAAGRAIIQSTTSWSEGKMYFKDTVQTLHEPNGSGGLPWHCRVSEHSADEVTFDVMWEKLSTNKAVNEMAYVPLIKKVGKIKSISPSQTIWTLYYTFTPPISPRVFTELQIIHYSESPVRTGIIVSLPIDLSGPGDEELAKLEEHGVRGRYASVEQVKDLGEGRTEWRMATCSQPGGRIPTFIAEASMPKSIAEDVPRFMTWIRTLQAEAGAPKA